MARDWSCRQYLYCILYMHAELYVSSKYIWECVTNLQLPNN